MNLCMAVSAWMACAQTPMHNPVARRNHVALLAGSASGLPEQTVIRRTMGTVTFSASRAVDKIGISHRMLIYVWPGIIGMAFLADPVQTLHQIGVPGVTEFMTVRAMDVAGHQRMPGTILELGFHNLVTCDAEVLSIVLDQEAVWIGMDGMTGTAIQIIPAMRVGGNHCRLMRKLMAA
jgi:hypothetical protein